MAVSENLAQYDTEENRKAYEALVNGNASSAASTATSQVPDDLAKYDTDENRKAYEAYSKEHAFDNGFTITYNGQKTSFTKEQTDLLKRAYQTLNQNDDFAKSALESYGNNAFDQFAMQNGLPSWKMFSTVQKYAAGGGVAENYGNLSDDQWKKINELWAKDWEYGLTDQDYLRKAAGLAPVAYDSMYEDTLLDQELKAKGLPPSKLLNGKLGEAYNTWAKNDATHSEIMNEIARRYVSSKSKSLFNGYNSEDKPFDDEERAQYDSMLMSDAILSVQNDPKYADFFGKHYGVYGTISDNPGNEYIMYEKDPITGEKYPITDENGDYVYDTQKFMEDRQKILSKNADLAADDFLITPDSISEYVSANELVIRADLAAEEWFKSNNIKFDYDTRGINIDYLRKVEDFANAFSIADEGGITLESLYTDAKTGKPTYQFTDEERKELQPLIDNLNDMLVSQGASAVDDYFKQGKWAEDVRKINHEKIVAGVRAGYAKESGFNDPTSDKYKSDDVILHDYYLNVAQQYIVDMDAEEAAAKLMSGELSIGTYMSEQCKTTESAAAYANSRLQNELQRMGVKDSAEEINIAIFNRKTARDLWNKYVNEGDEYLESAKTRDELVAERDRLQAIYDKYDAFSVPDSEYDEWKHAGGEIKRIDRAIKHLDEIIAIDANWENGMSDDEMENLGITVAAKRSQYLADALSYTEGFSAISNDANVNERAEQIFDANSNIGTSSGLVAKSAGIGLAGTLLLGLPIDVGANIGHRMLKDSDLEQNKDELYSKLTDEEKQKLVYMANTYGDNSEEVQNYVANVLTRVADRRARDEQKAETGWWGSDKHPAVSTFGAMMNTLIAPGLQPIEATANFYSDFENLLGEKDLYMSLRSNIFQDEIANIAESIGENAGEGWSFAYQLIPSLIQSTGQAVAAYFTGGASEIPTLIAAAMTSYSSAVDSALQQGATSKQAFLFGLASGTAEALFEKVSLDKFVKDTNVVLEAVRKVANKGIITNRKIFVKTWLEIFKQMAVQGGIEASEETFTTLANFMSEQGILRYNSTFNKNVRDLMAAGLSEDDAWKKASENFGKEIFMDGFAGFISGMLMSGARSIVQTRAGTLMFDRTGMTEFLTTTHNLSLISAEDAVNYVRANIDLTGKTNITASQARGIMNDLIRRGADSAVLARARNEILSAKPSSAVETVLNTMVSDQAKADATRLVGAAQKYIANNRGKGNSTVTKEQLSTVTNEYLAAVQTRVQDRDILDINKAAADIRADYVASVARLAGASEAANGMKAIFQYNNTLSAERQAAIKKGAERYVTKFKAANMTESEAAQYSMLASIIHDACADTNSLNALSPLFGESATYSPAAFDDACLNATGRETRVFIDAVCEAVSALEGQTVPHLTAAAMNGTNITAYAATQMAIARNATDPHSRAVYDYIVKHGASADLMDLLTAANIMQNMDKTQRHLLQSSIRVGNSFLTGEQLESVSSLYAKAQSAYQWYQDVLEQHKKSDAQKRVNEDARIAMYDTQIAELAKMIETETDPSLHETLIHKQTDNAKARQQAIDAKTEEQNRRAERMASTQKELNSARESAEHAKNEYTRKLMRHAAAYMQRMGDVYQGIMAKDHLSSVTIASKAAAVNYAEAENLKDIQDVIRSSEKAAAVALGRALGVTVEIVDFTDEFFDEKKVPNEQRNYDSNGVTIDGKVYLNEKSITAEVGSGTNAVILHEIGHIAEASADNYEKYAAFAKQYFENRDGKENVSRFLAGLVAQGMTEDQANRELVAEFTRQVALADPRAIRALTKSAPIMSTRIFQWLTNMNSSLTQQAREQANILRDAQREFAKALKAVKKKGTGSISSTYDIATTREAFANASEALNDRAQLEEQQQTETKEEPKTAQPTETTEQAETEQPVAEKQTAPVEQAEEEAQTETEETEQETEFVEATTEEESTDETAEEQPVEEPQEDFADIVVEEPQGDPDYLGYDEPTEVGKVESIKGETLAEDEWYEDSEGNKYDANGNRIETATKQTETPTSEQQAEETTEQGVNLPFELTDETRQRIMRVVAQLRTKNADSEGRVPKKTNDAIANVVKNQVTHDANYVDTSADVLNAFAEQFKAPQNDVASTDENDIYERQRKLMQGSTRNAPSQFNEEADPSRMNSAFADIQQDVSIPRAQYYTEYNPFEIDRRINSTRRQISQIEHDLGWEYEDNEFDRKRLAKLNNELHGLVEQERKATVKTSLGEVLENLMRYRKNDLISIANQLTDGAFDDVEELSASELQDSIREIINGRELSALEMQMRSIGVWVRPAMDAQAISVYNSIENLSDLENTMSGNPRMLQTENGYVVVRTFTKNGFTSGNPMTNGNGLQNIAMIAPVAAFENGFVDRAVPASKCTAVVIPNTDEYADMRTDARDAGAYVYGYDPSDPSMLDRAIDRAKDAQSVQYMPQMRYEDFIEKYGAHPYGAEPRVKNRPVPRQTTDTNRVSQMASNAATSPLTTDQGYEDIQGWIANNGTGTFTPQSNNRVLNRARGVIERAGSINQAAADLDRDVANGAGKATDLLARAELLYAQTQDPNSGLSILEREKIFGNLCIIASDAGRALQLASRLKYMTPEGHIAYIEQVGKRISEKHEKRTGKRTVLKPTQEEIDAYKGAQTVEEMEEIDKKVSERFGEETSDLTWIDRVRNWRYFAMLGNPRTHFRNMVGNALMNPVARVKDSINSIYQLGMDKSDRTTAFITKRADANTREFVNQMLKENLPRMQGVSEKYMEGVDNQSVRTIGQAWKTDVKSAALTKGRTAFGRALNRLSSFNSNMLELEDAKALSRRFRSAMYQIIQARGIDVNNITEQQKSDIVNYAMEESLRATFRDASALADALNKFANTNKATRLAMEAIVPFKRTPINIAKRSVEYSPIGLVNGLYKLFSANRAYNTDIKNIESMQGITDEERAAMRENAENTLKQNKIRAIDRLAAGTTGSLMTLIGIFASAMGWISIGRKDDEEAAFEQGLGKNTYSLNIGDRSIDLSAFSPAAVPLLMGTALYQAVGAEHDENFVSSMISVLAESVDPVTEMSMLSGIADALSSTSYGNEEGRNTRWFGAIAGNALESYVGQFVPTFVGQVNRTIDPYARSYNAGDDYWATKAFGSEIGSSVKNIQNKVFPWLSEPKVNIHGEEQRNYTNVGSWVRNFANNMLLPATIKVDQKNEIDDELIRLYGVVDSADLFPTKPSRNLGSYDNTPIKITSDSEYMQYQMEYGQTVYDMLEDLMLSPAYRMMTDTQKADAVERIIDQAKSATKKRWKAQKVANMR